MNIFEITELDIKNKTGNLKKAASSRVSSTKYFPTFRMNNKEKIFKPLSKTKPLSTPLFSYSEVYWSYLINKYIDQETPVYSLAYCKNLSLEQPKYYEKGCLVDNILDEGEELINIYELFEKYPDTLVNISDYINYCEVQYNYVSILNSTFFSERRDLRSKLAEQILCSILRRDANYHYENISLVIKNNKITRVAPIIDVEFSEFFMYPDNENVHKKRFSSYDEGMETLFSYDENLSYEENYQFYENRTVKGTVYDETDPYHFSNLIKNLKAIVELEPQVTRDFLNKLEAIKVEVEQLNILFDEGFLGKFSSKDWEATRMIYKDGKRTDDEEYQRKRLSAEKSRITLNQNEFNKKLKKEVLWSIQKLEKTLKFLLEMKDKKLPDLKNYKNITLYAPIERLPEDILKILTGEIQKNRKNLNVYEKKPLQ